TAWDGFMAEQRRSIWSALLERSAVVRTLWPRLASPTRVTNPIAAEEIIQRQDLRFLYALAHRENWGRIRALCTAYGIVPVFVLQPTSLYGLFAEGRPRGEGSSALYANFLIYEAFRASVRQFAAEQKGAYVLDMAAAFPESRLYYDGAHVYDEVNDL